MCIQMQFKLVEVVLWKQVKTCAVVSLSLVEGYYRLTWNRQLLQACIVLMHDFLTLLSCLSSGSLSMYLLYCFEENRYWLIVCKVCVCHCRFDNDRIVKLKKERKKNNSTQRYLNTDTPGFPYVFVSDLCCLFNCYSFFIAQTSFWK